MLSRIGRVAAGVLAALCLGGVGAATASAAEGPVWLVEAAELKTGETEKVVLSGNLSFPINKFGVLCNKVGGKDTLHGGVPGTDEGGLEYKECAVTGVANCTVKEPIVLSAISTLVFMIKEGAKWQIATKLKWEGSPEKAFGDEFVGSGEGNILTKVKIAGATCEVAGEYVLRGSYTGIYAAGLGFEMDEDTPSELTVNGKSTMALGSVDYKGELGAGIEVAA